MIPTEVRTVYFMDGTYEVYGKDRMSLVVENNWIRLNDATGRLYKIIPLHRVKEIKYER